MDIWEGNTASFVVVGTSQTPPKTETAGALQYSVYSYQTALRHIAEHGVFCSLVHNLQMSTLCS